MFGSTPERGVLTQCYLKPYSFQMKKPSFNVPCMFPIVSNKSSKKLCSQHHLSPHLFVCSTTNHLHRNISTTSSMCHLYCCNKPPLPQTITIEIFADHHYFDHGIQQFNVWVQ